MFRLVDFLGASTGRGEPKPKKDDDDANPDATGRSAEDPDPTSTPLAHSSAPAPAPASTQLIQDGPVTDLQGDMKRQQLRLQIINRLFHSGDYKRAEEEATRGIGEYKKTFEGMDWVDPLEHKTGPKARKPGQPVRSLALAPTYHLVYGFRGEARSAQGDWNGAEDDFNKGLILVRFLLGLLTAASQMGQEPPALEAKALAEQEKRMYFAKISCQRRTGHYNGASLVAGEICNTIMAPQFQGLDKSLFEPIMRSAADQFILASVMEREGGARPLFTDRERKETMRRIGLKSWLGIQFKCAACGEEETTVLCPGCRRTWYCNVDCQKADLERHNDRCTAIARCGCCKERAGFVNLPLEAKDMIMGEIDRCGFFVSSGKEISNILIREGDEIFNGLTEQRLKFYTKETVFAPFCSKAH